MRALKETGERFSVAAPRYDEHAHIQRSLAMELAQRVCVRPGDVVADVGTGTGSLLNALKAKEPGAVYVGIDAAEGMLAVAQGLRVCADQSRLPFKPESFDLVVSSSCYHWSPDLTAAFSGATRVLKFNGRFEAVLFGKETMDELFISLGAVSPVLAERLGRMPRLPSLDAVRTALSLSGFTTFDVKREIRRERFGSIRDVLYWLRETGTNGLGKGIFIGKDALFRSGEYFSKSFDGEVSFEVIWLTAGK